MTSGIVYHGVATRYVQRLPFTGYKPDEVCQSFVIDSNKNTDSWWHQMGSYRLIDNGKTYDSFLVNQLGNMEPLKTSKPITKIVRAELEREIAVGHLVLQKAVKGILQK